MNTLEIKDLTYFYPNTNRASLNNVNLSVNSGEFILLMGASGSGKTTLLQTMAGLTHIIGGKVRGRVNIEETDIVREPFSKRGEVVLVLQDPEPQLISLSVEDEIRFGVENLCLTNSEIDNRLEWVINKCRLDAVRKNYVYALSGGQKQRVVIAAGLAMKPKILLMDGPTTNLDPEGAREVLSIIHELRETKEVEVVVVSANKTDALLPIATRLLVLDQGNLILDGTPEDVIGQNHQKLDRLGLFLPEISRIYISLNGRYKQARFPRSVNDLAFDLKDSNLAKPTSKKADIAGHNTLVKLIDVWFGYTNKPVIQGITTDIFQGQSLAVVGQNGCGKTTLMSLVSGLKQPQKGRVSINGVNSRELKPGTIGYVFQCPDHQFVTPSVEAELSFGLQKLGQKAEEIKKRVDEVLELFGLSHLRQSQPYLLSMGEKRLLSVATMVVSKPKVLILDEPTTGLDAHLTHKLMQILQNLVVHDSVTVIQVSHDMEQVAEYCERVLVIDSGQILFDGTPMQLFANLEILQRCRLEAPPVVQLAQKLWPINNGCIPITIDEFFGKEKEDASLRVSARR